MPTDPVSIDCNNKAHPASAAPERKPCFDWYEQPHFVVITFRNLSGVKHGDVICEFADIKLDVTVKREHATDFVCEIALNHPVLPDKSKFRLVAGKSVEVTLFKAESYTWGRLEGDGTPVTVSKGSATKSVDSTVYPTSSQKGPVNWDKFVTDFEEEDKLVKKEGDDACNDLFKQIYSQSTPEVQKAMNKSYSESGGTVLSTNWDEVKQKKIDVNPPDCMEYKKYDT